MPWRSSSNRCKMFFSFCSGKKSTDPESPAYVLSLFEFTSSRNKRKADLSMTPFEAAKRRRQCRDEQVTKSNADGNILAERRHQLEVTLQFDKHSVEVQTDLTMDELASVESDYQLR